MSFITGRSRRPQSPEVPTPELVPLSPLPILPAVVEATGDRARLRFLEFFASNIRNPHTRRAYRLAVVEFLGRRCLGPPNRTQRLERCRGRLASIRVGRNPGDDAGVFGRGGNSEDPARFRCDVHRP